MSPGTIGKKGKRDIWRGPSIALSVVAVLATVLALVDYGVSYAVEDRFGIPHATTYSSTLDLLDLSGIAVTMLVTILGMGILGGGTSQQESLLALGIAAFWAIVSAVYVLLSSRRSGRSLFAAPSTSGVAAERV